MKNTSDKIGIPANFPKGYRKFPYIIIRAFHAIYIQVPIHFNVENDDFINFPGTHINGISPELIALYQQDKSSPLHDILIAHCQKIKKKLDTNGERPSQICLVESEDKANYFKEDNSISEGPIPFGGTLMTQTHKFIGMGEKHFIE